MERAGDFSPALGFQAKIAAAACWFAPHWRRSHGSKRMEVSPTRDWLRPDSPLPFQDNHSQSVAVNKFSNVSDGDLISQIQTIQAHKLKVRKGAGVGSDGARRRKSSEFGNFAYKLRGRKSTGTGSDEALISQIWAIQAYLKLSKDKKTRKRHELLARGYSKQYESSGEVKGSNREATPKKKLKMFDESSNRDFRMLVPKQPVTKSQDPEDLLPWKGNSHGSSGSPGIASFQIQIKTISGKTLLQWVRASDLVQDLKQALEIKLGIPSAAHHLLHEGKQLEDLYPLSFYSIQRNSSIDLTLRLRGGAAGQSSSAKTFSYKDAVHAKMPKRTDPPVQAPKPFLVDKLEETPSIEIEHPSLDEQTQHFAEHGIICRFNGLWPRTADLYQWIQSNWTNNCKVLLCSKGFFIVVFAFDKDYQKALTGGPWFWDAAGLFLTPWFPEFDPSTAVITKLPIWVRLPNLPANLWHFAVFQGIGNSLGRLLDTDVSRGEKGLYTFARICAEIDISKGLPDQINLKIGDFHWTQTLDYENTAFRCRNCHLTGHLQSSCPTMPSQKKKANTKQKSKSWKPHDPPPMDDFDFSSNEEEENKEGEAEASEPDPSSAGHAVSSVTPASQKRNHETSSSDSDKETSPSAHLSLKITPAQQNPPEWVKVGKKKGKKCRIVDSAHVG